MKLGIKYLLNTYFKNTQTYDLSIHTFDVSGLLNGCITEGSAFTGFPNVDSNTRSFADWLEDLGLDGLVTTFFIFFVHLEQYHTNLGSFTSFSVTAGL